jgi:hypothetical protein
MKGLSLFLGLGLALVATPLFAQAVPLEHFQCYSVLNATPNVNVPLGLRDQFNQAGTAPEQVNALRAMRFCNPAGKFHRNQFFPIADDRQHLMLYATFPQAGPVRAVALSNQFDRAGQNQVWWLGEPVAILVPTQKPPHPKPEGLDHFRCYAASGPAVLETVGLIDQFLPFGGRAVLNPKLFCNPVEKTRLDTGEVTPILHPDLHLACYSTTRVPFQTSRDIINQFGTQVVNLGPPDTLCVPTRKLAWVPIPDAPIGTPTAEGLDISFE